MWREAAPQPRPVHARPLPRCAGHRARAEGDDLAARLVAEKLAGSEYLLENGRSLATPYDMVLEAPWSLPSRMFRFPIEFMAGKRRADGMSRLLLKHPKLTNHPFVRRVETTLGLSIGWEPEDEFGRRFGELATWWHAIDLMTEKHWQDLCCTSEFTTREAMIRAIGLAVAFSAGSEGAAKKRPALALEHARYLLGVLDAPEPADRSDAFLRGEGLWPSHIVERHPRTNKVTSERWAVNMQDQGAAGTWAHVHGIEDGWLFRDRSGHLQVSAEGLRRREQTKVAA